MCTTTGVASIWPDLADLASVDVSLLPDQQVRDELIALLGAVNSLNAAVLLRAAAFDARGLSEVDGFRTAAGWLIAFGHLGRYAAGSMVKRARVLRELPALADAAARGAVSDDHLGKVVKLADDVGVVAVKDFDAILAELAAAATPAEVGRACERIRAYVDPDGRQPDPARDFARRGLTVTRQGSMLALRGRLDPGAGSALMAALDALMRPPASDDLRTPAQRRADALADLARGALAGGGLPLVGGVRPQVGILIPADSIPADSLPHRDQPARRKGARDPWRFRPADPDMSKPAPGEPAADADGASNAASRDPADADGVSKPVPRDPLVEAGLPPRVEPAWLDWYGDDVHLDTARRIACDSDVWRVVLDPSTGLPLDVGRSHRTAPRWIRKALHARDRGCRWPGCTTPAQWCDAHHWQHWIDGGQTSIDNMLLTCRYHHVLVHEGQWTMDFDQTTGEVRVTRPDGTPYELGPTAPATRRAA